MTWNESKMSGSLSRLKEIIRTEMGLDFSSEVDHNFSQKIEAACRELGYNSKEEFLHRIVESL